MRPWFGAPTLPHDAMIAGQACSQGLIPVSGNVREFACPRGWYCRSRRDDRTAKKFQETRVKVGLKNRVQL
jgi:hypothetical protein